MYIWCIKCWALTVKDCGFRYMISKIWLGLLGVKEPDVCRNYTIRERIKWNRIEFQKFTCKKEYAACGCKNKRNVFSIAIIVIAASALSERENVKTYLSIVNEKLLSRRYGMTLVSLQHNHPWQIRYECNDRYVFNNEDSSPSFELVRCVQIARQFLSFTAIEESNCSWTTENLRPIICTERWTGIVN